MHHVIDCSSDLLNRSRNKNFHCGSEILLGLLLLFTL